MTSTSLLQSSLDSTRSWDVIVVGGGVAGLVAANRAAERRRTVLLLEKGGDERYPCNTRFSGGAFHICMRDVYDEPAALHAAIMEATDGTADPSLAATLIERGPATLQWLRQRGVRFGRVPAINQQNVLLPLRPNRAGVQWQGRGGDVFVHQLGMQLLSSGGSFVRGARAQDLLCDDKDVIGVRVAAPGGRDLELHARAIVLADGGYQASAALLHDHVCPMPERVMQRNARTGCGDGLRMAVDAGAALRGMDGGFYGHILSREALQNDRLWPFPILDFLGSAGIVVDAQGRRFCDETLGGVYVANAIARLPDPACTHVVFDEAMWQTAGAFRAIPPNPHLVLAGGTVHSGASVRELAGRIGLPPDTLEATVDTANQAIAAGHPERLQPPRARATGVALLHRAPFHAIPLAAGITYTLGGIRTDAHARVLRGNGTPIRGLYAAGATTGGLEGGPHSGYVGGLMKSAVFGWLAGSEA